MEASVDYAYSEVAAEKIKKFNEKSKIIYMIRDLKSFLISLHNHMVFYEYEVEKDFNNAIQKTIGKGQRHRFSEKLPFPEYINYEERISFSKHLQKFLNVFDEDNILLLQPQDLMNSRQTVLRKIAKFLNIKNSFSFENKVHNKGKQVRFPLLKKIGENQNIYKIFKKILPKTSYNTLKNIFYNLTLTDKKIPTLNPEIKNLLKTRLEQESKKLNKIISKNYNSK